MGSLGPAGPPTPMATAAARGRSAGRDANQDALRKETELSYADEL